MKNPKPLPSLDEYDGLWLSPHAKAQIETSEQYLAASTSLLNHLGEKYRISRGLAGGDCYVRGDFIGDRTQYVELYMPELLTIDFITYLQLWLQTYENGEWRILIPTYLDNAGLSPVVYSKSLRLGREFEGDIGGTLRSIIVAMRAADAGKNVLNPPRQ